MAEKKVVFITGASSGIGEATAKKLLMKGYVVFGTSRDAEPKILESYDEKAVNIMYLDLNDDDSISNAISNVYRLCRKIDIVVNNAGIGMVGPIENVPVEDVKKLFDVNFFGQIKIIQTILPIFRSQKQGLIVNVSSLAGKFALPFQGYYSASKFAIEAVSESLHMELSGEKEINVLLIEPGDTNTNFTVSRIERMPVDSSQRQKIQKVLEIIKRDERGGSTASKIASGIEKVVSMKKHSKLRYPIGKEVPYVTIAHYLLPDKLFCYLLNRHYGG